LTTKGKYDKIANYNLSYENMLEAVSEFDGYVLGLSRNDITLFNSIPTNVSEFLQPAQKENSEDPALKEFEKKIFSRILDRTTGAYFMNDLFNARVHDSYFKSVVNPLSEDISVNSELTGENDESGNAGLGQYMHLVMPGEINSLGTSGLEGTNVFSKCLITGEEYMNQVIGFNNFSGKLKKIDKTDSSGQIVTDKDGVPKQSYTVNQDGEAEPGIIEINQSLIGDRYNSPSLGAMVMRHPSTSLQGRNKSHLPIFFNAIPPIEMSRCTPYISITVISRDYGTSSKKLSNMNQVGYMRFIKSNDKNNYELDDISGFGNVTPINNETTLKERSEGNDVTTKYSFMDMFNAPQTMANANINKEGVDLINLNYNNDDPVLDPITPMLSLSSLNISISGAGYGIMASKKGSLSFVLHDRSRLRDMGPLLSSNRFASTKVIIEYGWNHPEGGIQSDNIIGKYLSGLKDRAVYQLVGSKYGFGDGNTVKIDLDLAAYGYRQNERLHCGSGPNVPINILEDLINQATSDILKSEEGIQDAPELRQKIKLNSRNARSVNTAISWQAYRKISESLKPNAPGGNQNLINSLKNILKTDTELAAGGNGSDSDSIDQSEIGAAEQEIEDMVSRMIGKLEGIKDPGQKNKDPFLQSTVTHADYFSDSTEDTVSLGKIISHFVGHSLAGACIYDEVQLVFYPLNHHAAGGRVHTTASLPIPIKKLEQALDDELNKTSQITVKRFFTMLEKIVRDRNLSCYGLSDILEDQNRIQNKNNKDEQVSVIKERIASGNLDGLGIGEAEIALFGVVENYDDIFSEEQQEKVKTSNEKLTTLKNEQDELKRKLAEKTAEIKKLEETTVKLPDAPTAQDLKDAAALPEPQRQERLDELKSLQEKAEVAFGKKADNAEKLIKLKSEETEIRANFELKTSEVATANLEREGLLARKKAFDDTLKEVAQKISAETRTNVAKKCLVLYQTDGLTNYYPAEAKFVRPNISMDFEVIEAIEPPSESYKPWQLKKKYEAFKNSGTDGIQDDKTILRIHIYDEEAVLDPAKFALHSTMIEGGTNKVSSGKELETIKEEVGSLNFNAVKQIMKRSYPTLIYGANGSTVKTMSVSSNTSGEMANVLLVESYGELRDGNIKGHNYETEFESITTFPNTVSVSMLGMPMIGRGNSIFIDFGTNTSLDSIYTVKTVTHSLNRGDFSTTLNLVPSNIGAISTFKETITNSINAIEGFIKIDNEIIPIKP
jgi:hypothetical protein